MYLYLQLEFISWTDTWIVLFIYLISCQNCRSSILLVNNISVMQTGSCNLINWSIVVPFVVGVFIWFTTSDFSGIFIVFSVQILKGHLLSYIGFKILKENGTNNKQTIKLAAIYNKVDFPFWFLAIQHCL
jgi:hypothetical protein